MPNFITQVEVDEMEQLAMRWESLTIQELKRFLYLAKQTQHHVATIKELFGGNDEMINEGMPLLIKKIQRRISEVADA
jgi:hypothetical protein